MKNPLNKNRVRLLLQSLLNLGILLLLVFAPDGADASPYTYYCIDPLIIGAGIAGGLGLFGSIFGSSSASSANAQNLAFQEKWNNQNQANWQANFDRHAWEYQDQKDFYEYMLNKQNEYNSPLAQRQRYEQAGINPYFALGNIQSGQMQSSFSPSAGGLPSAASFNTTGVDPNAVANHVQSGFQAVANSVDSYFNNQQKAAQTEQLMIDNLTRYQENIARLQGLLSNKDLTDARKDEIFANIKTLEDQRDIITTNLRKQGRVLSAQGENTETDTHLKRLQAQGVQLQNELQGMINNAFPANNQAQLKQIYSTINANFASASANLASGRLSLARAATETVEKSIRELNKKGIQIDLKYKNEMTKAILKGLKIDSEMKEFNYDSRYWDKSLNAVGTIGGLFSPIKLK